MTIRSFMAREGGQCQALRMMIPALALALVVGGCDKKTPPSGQVLAEVDGAEITSAQLAVLASDVPAANRKDPGVQAALVQRLIDETVLMRAAEEAGLDKDPSVARQIDRARRALLAQAYVAKFVTRTAPLAGEVREFYDKHPAMFARRRSYAVTQVSARGGKELDALVAPLGETLTLDALVARLSRGGETPEVRKAQFRADELPPELADQFSRLNVGSAYSLRAGATRQFGQIEAITESPVSFEAAREGIASFIVRRNGQEATASKLAALKAENKVVMGDLGTKMLAGRQDIADPAPAAGDNDRERAARERAVAKGLSGI